MLAVTIVKAPAAKAVQSDFDPTIIYIVGLIFFLLVVLPLGRLLARYIISKMAENDFLFTFRNTDHFTYLIEGSEDPDGNIKGDLINVLIRSPRYSVDQATGEVTVHDTPQETSRTISERIFGAYYIGFPPRNMMRWLTDYARPLKPGDLEKQKQAEQQSRHDAKFKEAYDVDVDHNIVRRTTRARFFPVLQQRSIYVKGIEVKGMVIDSTGNRIEGFVQIDIWGTITLRTLNAITPVITYNGDWFSVVEDAVRGAIIQSVENKTVDDIRKMPKSVSGQNAPTPFESDILASNNGPSGIMERVRMMLESFNFGGMEVTKTEVEEAFDKATKAALNLKAKEADAKAAAAMVREVGAAQAEAYEGQIKAFGSGNEKLAARVIAMKFRSEGMKGLQVYAESNGGSTPPIIVGSQPSSTSNTDRQQHDGDETDSDNSDNDSKSQKPDSKNQDSQGSGDQKPGQKDRSNGNKKKHQHRKDGDQSKTDQNKDPKPGDKPPESKT